MTKHMIPILAMLVLSGCAGFDAAMSEAQVAREAVSERVDATIVGKVCRMHRTRLLELVDGDVELADAIERRCAERAL